MASTDIALVCGLNFQVGCQDVLRVIQMLIKHKSNGIAEVSEVLAHNHFNFFLYSADVTFNFDKL